MTMRCTYGAVQLLGYPFRVEIDWLVINLAAIASWVITGLARPVISYPIRVFVFCSGATRAFVRRRCVAFRCCLLCEG